MEIIRGESKLKMEHKGKQGKRGDVKVFKVSHKATVWICDFRSFCAFGKETK